MFYSVLKKAAFLLLLLSVNLPINAQVIPTDSMLSRVLSTDQLLPMLLDSAIKNSGLVHRTNSSIELWKESEQVDKKSILNSLSFVSSFNSGTTGDLTIGSNNGSANPFSNFRSSKSDRYNVGINLQVPLGSLLSRKNIMRTSHLQAQMASDERDNATLYVKQEVIRLYQEMKLSQKLLITGNQGKQAAFVNYSLAEKDFLHGGGNLETLSRLLDIYSKSSIEFEIYVGRFQTSYLQLQMYTGTTLSTLIALVK
ncbi:MAG: TolC family protein [Chitinophagaceae bacterium]|nr:TolC family protein [Chitinophagaceae bacterium]